MMNFIESFFMLGILAGYFIFSRYINDINAGSALWFNVYYIMGTFSAIAFLLLLLSKLNESSIKNEGRFIVKQQFSSMIKLIIVPLIISFAASVFLYTLIEQSIMCWLPTFNNKQLQISSSISIQVTGILALSVAAGRFFAGFLIKKINWFKFLTGCLVAIMLLVIITLPFANQSHIELINTWAQVPLVAFIFPLIGFFLAPVYPIINSVMLSSLPANKHPLMAGLIIMFSSLGGMTGSVITGFIFQSYGGRPAFYVSLIPLGILIIMLFIFRRNKDRGSELGSYKNVRVALA
jgi:fucose permease